MNTKNTKTSTIHKARKKEIDLVFKTIPPKIFKRGLELGAGDGFQSKLLKKYAISLISTEYNWERLKKDDKKIKYMKCDAEKIDSYFKKQEFDLIFSSNVLEHLQNPQIALKKMHRILRDDGIIVHIMPNPCWKISMLLLFYPVFLVDLPAKVLRKMARAENRKTNMNKQKATMGNNPKFCRQTTDSTFMSMFPQPHGAYKGNFEEIIKYRKQRWKKEIEKAGFEIIQIRKGPFCFGYFSRVLDVLNNIFEKLGLSTEYVYIAKKSGKRPIYGNLFTK